jgi:hypothetical protein
LKNQSEKITVKFHSGYKGEEIPRSVIFDQQEFPIEKILERKRILNLDSGKNREEYRIKIKNRTAILKIHDSSECEIKFLRS